ncbi:MAG: hypothetical protein V2A55_02540 [Candidatus Jorgensenbacteria bacterium]
MKNIDYKKIIFSFRPLSVKSYENFDLDRLVVYSLIVLERKKIPLYFDHIVVGLFKMFPNKFSMANFKEYPDTNRINKSLRRLADPKRKNWATGNIENGFCLTETGKEVALQTEDLLKHPTRLKLSAASSSKRSRGRSPQDDVLEMEKSHLFQKWQNKDFSVTDYEVLSFLKAVPYTPQHLLSKYLEQLKQSAAAAKNKKVLAFLDWLEKEFKNLFQ